MQNLAQRDLKSMEDGLRDMENRMKRSNTWLTRVPEQKSTQKRERKF